MRIGMVGAGRVGCSLAIGLKNKGFAISGIYSRSDSSASYLNMMVGTCHSNMLEEVVKNSEVIFLTVPDMELARTAENISTISRHEDICGKVFLHCSGAATSEVLESLKNKGACTGSLHPIQTFADRENGWKGLEGIFFGFEGDEGAEKVSETVVKAFSSNLISIKKEDKPLYHAAACVLSNYMVTLSYIAGNMLEAAGIDPVTGYRAFTPLIENTLGNIGRVGSVKALTGPVSRGDFGIIREHMAEMSKKCPEFLNVYRILAEHTVQIALKSGTIDCKQADLLKKALEEEYECR